MLKYREDHQRVEQHGIADIVKQAFAARCLSRLRVDAAPERIGRRLRAGSCAAPGSTCRSSSSLAFTRSARRRRARRPRRRLLGRAGHARAPPRGPRALRPGVQRVLGGPPTAGEDVAGRGTVTSRSLSMTTTPTTPRRRRHAERPTSRRSSCASAPPRCCGTRTSPTTPTTELSEAQQLMTSPAPRRSATT